MILIEFTPTGGSLHRIAMADTAIEHQWLSVVVSFSSLKIALPYRHGGIAKPEFSDITLSPEIVTLNGSVPRTATIKVYDTDSTEAASVLLFDGTARLVEFDRSGFKYALHRPSSLAKTTKTTAYSNTLVNIATTLCTAMSLSIDTTLARSPSPAVSHTAEKDELIFDLLSDMLAFFSHGAEIRGTTLYLFDMLGSQTATELTEFNYTKGTYQKDKGYALFSNGDEVSIEGSFEGGDEYNVKEFHATTANIQAALADIKTIVEKDIATIQLKQTAASPQILRKIFLTDESIVAPIEFTGIITSVIYSHDSLDVEIEATGDITE